MVRVAWSEVLARVFRSCELYEGGPGEANWTDLLWPGLREYSTSLASTKNNEGHNIPKIFFAEKYTHVIMNFHIRKSKVYAYLQFFSGCSTWIIIVKIISKL
jgi:hypothetical protein